MIYFLTGDFWTTSHLCQPSNSAASVALVSWVSGLKSLPCQSVGTAPGKFARSHLQPFINRTIQINGISSTWNGSRWVSPRNIDQHFICHPDYYMSDWFLAAWSTSKPRPLQSLKALKYKCRFAGEEYHTSAVIIQANCSGFSWFPFSMNHHFSSFLWVNYNTCYIKCVYSFLGWSVY